MVLDHDIVTWFFIAKLSQGFGSRRFDRLLIGGRREIGQTAPQSLFLPQWSSVDGSFKLQPHTQTAPLGATK